MRSNARLDVIAGAIGGLLVLLAFVPWTTSGSVSRNGWSTAISALRLDAVDGAARAVTVAWLFVPPLVGVSWLAALLDRRAISATAAIVVGGLSIVAAVAVRTGPLQSTAAPVVVLLVGCALVAVGSLMLWSMRHGFER